MKKQAFIIEYANGEKPSIVAETKELALLLACADNLHQQGKNAVVSITIENGTEYQIIDNKEFKNI